jgi:hypothetical protein
VVVPPFVAAVDTTHADAILRSLALLEERLRAPAPTPTATPTPDQAITALERMTNHLETVSKSMEAMGSRMEVMVKETKSASSQAKTTWILVLLLSAVVIVAAFLPMFLGR